MPMDCVKSTISKKDGLHLQESNAESGASFGVCYFLDLFGTFFYADWGVFECPLHGGGTS